MFTWRLSALPADPPRVRDFETFAAAFVTLNAALARLTCYFVAGFCRVFFLCVFLCFFFSFAVGTEHAAGPGKRGWPYPTLCAQCQGEVIPLMVVFSREWGQLLCSRCVVWFNADTHCAVLAPARGVPPLVCCFYVGHWITLVCLDVHSFFGCLAYANIRLG